MNQSLLNFILIISAIILAIVGWALGYWIGYKLSKSKRPINWKHCFGFQ